ncbi:MAG TPA: hypothetical protein VFZ17_05355 [Acidimicrobiia bacterium]|nr:hypothetical protein [Acidimicrobiia bacterium]
MSPSRSSRPTTAKRVPYKPPRDRREVVTAITVGVLIVVVTATLVWFLRPNRESTSTPSVPLTSVPTSTAVPGDTTPGDTTPSDTTPTDTTAAETAPPSGG